MMVIAGLQKWLKTMAWPVGACLGLLMVWEVLVRRVERRHHSRW
jgi:hypothetical protein